MGTMQDIGFYLINLIFCVTIFLTNAGEDYPEFGQPVANYDNGKTQLTQLQGYSKNPRYGKCWTGALERLHQGCKQLTEEEQGRMALSFATCHLEKAGLDSYQCSEDEDLTTCLRRMKGDIVAFNAYTEFFTHTQDICFFLQSQVWHERTEQTVSRLAVSSENVAEQLDESSKLQEEMIAKQSDSLEQQAEILKNEAYLKEALKTNAKDIEQIFSEMKENTENQQAQLDATFNRVTQIQRVVLGEFTWFNSFLFFAVAVLIAYLVTSTPRTTGARLPMFAVLAVDWVVERMIFSATDSSDHELVYNRMWICRQLFCFIAFLVLVIFAYRFKNFGQINYKLLLDIKRQNSELRHSLEHPTIMSALKTSSHATLAMMGAPMHALGHRQMPQDLVDSPVPLAIGAFSSDEEATSDSDHTYLPEITYQANQDDTESVESFITADPASRVATPTLDDSMTDRTSTPTYGTLDRSGLFNSSTFNASTFMAPTSQDSSGGSSATSSMKRPRGRPKGSKNRSSRESTPSNKSFSSRYNLRNRSGVYSPEPIVHEDVRTFIQHVESYQQRQFAIHSVEPVSSSANRLVRRNTPQSNSSGFFSSDDEM